MNKVACGCTTQRKSDYAFFSAPWLFIHITSNIFLAPISVRSHSAGVTISIFELPSFVFSKKVVKLTSSVLVFAVTVNLSVVFTGGFNGIM